MRMRRLKNAVLIVQAQTTAFFYQDSYPPPRALLFSPPFKSY